MAMMPGIYAIDQTLDWSVENAGDYPEIVLVICRQPHGFQAPLIPKIASDLSTIRNMNRKPLPGAGGAEIAMAQLQWFRLSRRR